jgi:hypothetical protein
MPSRWSLASTHSRRETVGLIPRNKETQVRLPNPDFFPHSENLEVCAHCVANQNHGWGAKYIEKKYPSTDIFRALVTSSFQPRIAGQFCVEALKSKGLYYF